MFTKPIHFALVFAFLMILTMTREKVDARLDSASICKGLKGMTGWGCDDPFSRGLWRRINGVSTCHDFCRKRLKKSGGRCVYTNNYDQSSWCKNKGESCQCY